MNSPQDFPVLDSDFCIRQPAVAVRHGAPPLPVLFAALCIGASIVPFASAGEILAARFRITPEHTYVGQPFEIRLEVEVTPGAEVQDLQLEDCPLDSIATLSAYQKEDRRQVRRGDTTVDLLSFMAGGRAVQPTRHEFHGTLHARLVERYSMGFFSSFRTGSATVRLEPLRVDFQPLPTANVPPGFQGAIGMFTLTGKIEPAQAAPGDIVNLNYTVAGHGWLRDAQVILPQPDPNFRVYPPQETRRDENGQLALRQVVIPLNTNATSIGMARLPFFDPVAGVYCEATAGPLRLILTPPQATGSVPAVKHLDVLSNPVTPAEAGDAVMAGTMTHARQLLPFAAVILLAMIAAGMLYGWRPRLAIGAGIVVLAVGIYMCQRWCGQARPHGREVRVLVAARLCPSDNARILFHISPGRQVTPLEMSEEWVRVDSDGRYGWIPVRTMK